VRRGSQVACASPSPLSFGAAGPRHRRRYDRSASATVGYAALPPLCLAHRAAARMSPRCLHLVKRVAATLTVLTPPFSGHLVRRSTRASRAAPPPRAPLPHRGSPGHGPADRTWQATTPCTVAAGRALCGDFKSFFN
jgi:hypothetical protein